MIRSEQLLDTLFNDLSENSQKIILIFVSQNECEPSKSLYPFFISLSKKYKNYYFAFLNLENYSFNTGKYTSSVTGTPTVLFYKGRNFLKEYQGGDYNELQYEINEIHEIKNKKIIQNSKPVVEEKIQPMIQQNQKTEKQIKEEKIEKIEQLISVYNKMCLIELKKLSSMKDMHKRLC